MSSINFIQCSILINTLLINDTINKYFEFEFPKPPATIGWKCTYSTITLTHYSTSYLTSPKCPHYNGALYLLCPKSVPCSKIRHCMSFRAKSAIFGPKIPKCATLFSNFEQVHLTFFIINAPLQYIDQV